MFQDDVCTPEDILGLEEREDVAPLARTLFALLAHATPRPPKDVNQSEAFRQTHNQSEVYCESYNQPESSAHAEEYANEYYENVHQVTYHTNDYRCNEDRYISNFNYVHENHQHYTIDEAEEYQVNSEQEQNTNYMPIYGNDTVKNRGAYYQKNRVQFVTPFCKNNGVLKGDSMEIYDTDEVDCPVVPVRNEADTQRYDRGKMNLDITNNLNRDLDKVNEAANLDEQNRLFYTCLCLGAFFISVIVLYLFPL